MYTLGAYGRGAAYTWASPFVTAGASAGVLIATAAADGALVGEDPSVLTAVLIGVPLGVSLCVMFALAWGAGLVVRSRRVRAVARDDLVLSHSVGQAEAAADAERHRLATRLGEAVLHRTRALVELAHQGRLDEVAAAARAALAAMRDLLRDMDDGQDCERRVAAQPTAADLDALCRTPGPFGRRVTVRGILKSAAGLPGPVMVTVYRMVESALGAGDRGPARIHMRRRRGSLYLTITGVRLAATGPVAERLRAQATAGEGHITLEPAGTVRVLLPLSAGPDPASAQEVSPSPHA
ncbi:hypothetical protein OHB54_02820 [Streptomyces sp. NBC_01007]|nr:hypothetical protein OHB54_02820 [Streptomyces sp. NBC_01007]